MFSDLLSDDSIDENELIEKLPFELKERLLFHKNKRTDELVAQLVKYTHYAFPQDKTLDIQMASSQWVYNRIQNDGEVVLIFDMRSMYDIFRGQINHNFKSQSNLPLPSDFIIENKLNIQEHANWIT